MPGTVLHGLPADLLTPQPAVPSYLAFLGRICPEKRPDRAIRIARASGIPLKIAAKIDRVDAEYFESIIKPMIAEGGVELVGEINEQQKPAFLSGARALLMPIDWPEPFGLVMIEAMACGTPIIAYNHGSVPEIIDDGVTGFIVEDEMSAIAAVRRLAVDLPRRCARNLRGAVHRAPDGGGLSLHLSQRIRVAPASPPPGAVGHPLQAPKTGKARLYAERAFSIYKRSAHGLEAMPEPKAGLAYKDGSNRLEVRRRRLAAFHCHFVADLLAFVQAPQAGCLNRRDVDENVLAAILRHNEPEALGGVEPLHSADRHSCIHSVPNKPRAATIGPSSIDDAVRQRRNKAGQTLNAH